MRRPFGHGTGRRGCRRPGSGSVAIYSLCPRSRGGAGLAPRFRTRNRPRGVRRPGSGFAAVCSPRPRSRGGGRACAAPLDMEQAAECGGRVRVLRRYVAPPLVKGRGPGLCRMFEKGNRPPGAPAACCWLQGLTAPGALLFSPCPCLPFPGAFPGGASARRPRSLSGPRSSPPAPAGR